MPLHMVRQLPHMTHVTMHSHAQLAAAVWHVRCDLPLNTGHAQPYDQIL